jgi:hypothetical protein
MQQTLNHDEENWVPKSGEWVVYRPVAGAPEDGVVTGVLDHRRVWVRYEGEKSSKLTYVRDLRPARY